MSELRDEELYAVLRTVWEQRDPVPDGLVARLQEAAALAAGDLGLEIELMLLVERSEELLGARGRSATAYTLRFAHAGVDLLLRISSEADTARVDGWVVPPSPLTVRVVGEREPRDDAPVVVGGTGRFELTGLRRGLLRLRLEPADGATPFQTPAFEI
jgi:hypothetical protein